MKFRPNPSDKVSIGDTAFRFVEHPSAPGTVHAQTGRRGTVYKLKDEETRTWALKVFRAQFREPRLVGQAERIQEFASLPGLRVCEREVLTSSRHVEVIREHMELAYAVLMPWIDGHTWQEIVIGEQKVDPERALILAQSIASTLLRMEERGLAHCDLSGPNVIVAPDETVELVDLEEMYGPDLVRPKSLPGGSPGYAHKTAPEGLWRDEADRFAGGVLIAEMLGWTDERVRGASWGEGYFNPHEVQSTCERYRLLAEVLFERWGPNVKRLFERAWKSTSLVDCPTFSEWMAALPEHAPAKLPGASRKVRADLSTAALVMSAQDATLEGEIERAKELYREAAQLAAPELRERIEGRVEALGGSDEQGSERLEGWECGACAFWVAADHEICPHCEVGRRPDRRAGAQVFRSSAEGDEHHSGFREKESETHQKRINHWKATILKKRHTLSIVIVTLLVGFAGLLFLSIWSMQLILGGGTGGQVGERALGQRDRLTLEPFEGVLIEELRTLDVHSSEVWDLEFSPDSSILASSSADGTISVLNATTGQQVRVLRGHRGAIRTVSFAPEGEILASGSTDGLLSLWDLHTGERVVRKDAPGSVWNLAYSPDGTRVAVASSVGSIYIWNTQSGDEMPSIFVGGLVWDVAFAPDSQVLASASANGSVMLWDLLKRERLTILEGARSVPVGSVSFAPNGTILASGNRNGFVTLWNVDDGRRDQLMKGHSGWIWSVAFSPDGRALASGSSDGTVILWDTSTGERLHTLEGHNGSVKSVAFAPNGELLASGSEDGMIVLWDLSQ